MTCPSCRSAMNDNHDHWNCPTCQGQFYSASQTTDINEAWRHSIDTYYKAMRDEKETYRAERKGGYNRIIAKERQSWDVSMRIY